MKNKEITVRDLMEQFYRVVNKFNEVDKSPFDFGIGETLHPSEIHTIEAIGNESGINVTGLAQKLGITKGAVSQMISKLQKRGLINKVKSVDNDKEVLLILTAKGKTAFDGHERFHNDMYSDFAGYIDEITADQLDVFKTVLDKVDFYIDRYRRNQKTSVPHV